MVLKNEVESQNKEKMNKNRKERKKQETRNNTKEKKLVVRQIEYRIEL